MKIFTYLLSKSRGTFILAVMAGLISGGTTTGIIALIHRALSVEETARSTLVWAFVGLVAVVLLSEIIAQVLLYLAQKVVFDLRVWLSERILSTPLRQLEEIGAPRVLAVLTDDVTAIANAITMSPLIFISMTVVIGSLVYMGWLSPIMLLITLGFIMLGIFSFQLPRRKAAPYLNRARESQDNLFGGLRALAEGTKELKIHRRRRATFHSQILIESSRVLMRERIKGMSIFRIAGAWGQLITLIIIGLLLFAIPQILDFNTQLLTGYTLALLYMMVPMSTLMNVMPTLGVAGASLRKIQSLGLSLENDQTVSQAEARDESPPFRSLLELVGVTHTYHREKENSSFTLGPIDLALRPGELVFIIGGNGSGKTTLVKLLTGLYTPEAGEIRLDGQPIIDQNRDDYRQLFSVVFSDFYLFERLLGLDHLELDEQAQEYLVQLQLNHKVKVENGVLSTTALSQGQRKRLALLTAYLENRPIYVFDEWAADQDPLFKELFYTRLLPELRQRGKTVLVITHDDRYFHTADRIIKLDDGKVVYDRPAAEALSELSVPRNNTEMMKHSAGSS
ncbi:MAG: ABC transporter ATP-binding protein [Herpetosiphonaceae bacterium]|nr:MAG: ABC transporter ATP-binding protein [Herpetosiphonaceae bacterium]